MVQEDSGGVAAPMGYSRQRSVDPSHYPMCRGVGGEETRIHDISSHPGTNRAWLLSELPEENWSVTCPETYEDMRHALFVCPRFWEERERFRALREGPLTPEGIGRCLLSSQRGWDAVIGLATGGGQIKLHNARRRKKRKPTQWSISLKSWPKLKM